MLEQKRLLSKVQVLGQENLGSPGVVWVSWAEVKAILSAVLVRSLRLLRCPKRSQTLEVPQLLPRGFTGCQPHSRQGSAGITNCSQGEFTRLLKHTWLMLGW